MAIKSSQTLVAEALKTVKTISPEEALKLVSENKCNLIDIRDASELQREGSVENSFHISRGLLEFAIHPDSVFSQREKLDPRGSGSFIDMGVYKPLIAAIDGFCVAGGLEVSLQCDIRIATKKSEFGLPEPRWSILAGYGLHNLNRMIPLGESLYMQLTGSRINSERAYNIGLIQEVVEDREELFSCVDRIAEEIKLCAPLAVQAIKQIVYLGRNLPVEYSQKFTIPISQRISGTEDSIEGPKAFSEKRKPKWKMK